MITAYVHSLKFEPNHFIMSEKILPKRMLSSMVSKATFKSYRAIKETLPSSASVKRFLNIFNKAILIL